MSRKMAGRDISAMGRELESHLKRLEQMCLEPLALYMEAIQWTYKSPIELLRYQNDPNRQGLVERIIARPQQLSQWAERFWGERNRLVQMVNRYPPRAIQMSGLDHRIRNIISKLETNANHFQNLSETLQEHIYYLLNPGDAPQIHENTMPFLSPLTSSPSGSKSPFSEENNFEDNLLSDDLDDILNSSSSSGSSSSRQSSRNRPLSQRSTVSARSSVSSIQQGQQEEEQEDEESDQDENEQMAQEEAENIFANMHFLPDDILDYKLPIRRHGL